MIESKGKTFSLLFFPFPKIIEKRDLEKEKGH